jgi:hypothetical protein
MPKWRQNQVKEALNVALDEYFLIFEFKTSARIDFFFNSNKSFNQASIMSTSTVNKRRSFFQLKKNDTAETSTDTLTPSSPPKLQKKKSFFRKFVDQFKKTPVVPPIISITQHDDEEYKAENTVEVVNEEAKAKVEEIWKQV